MSKRFTVYQEGALVPELYMIEESHPFLAGLTCTISLQDLKVDYFGTWATSTDNKTYYVCRDEDK
jgi:hypothetical protein